MYMRQAKYFWYSIKSCSLVSSSLVRSFVLVDNMICAINLYRGFQCKNKAKYIFITLKFNYKYINSYFYSFFYCQNNFSCIWTCQNGNFQILVMLMRLIFVGKHLRKHSILQMKYISKNENILNWPNLH